MPEWTRERQPKGGQRRLAPGTARQRRGFKPYSRSELHAVAYEDETCPRSFPVPQLYQVRDGSGSEELEQVTILDFDCALKDEYCDIPAWNTRRDEPRRTRSPSIASSTSSGPKASETWDIIDPPARTDTLDTQPPTRCDILRSHRSRSLDVVEVPNDGWQDEFGTDGEEQTSMSTQDESDFELDDTPGESSDSEAEFSTEEEAESWLRDHFSDEEVQTIKAAWKWSTQHGNWIHYDQKTGAVVEWPKDLF